MEGTNNNIETKNNKSSPENESPSDDRVRIEHEISDHLKKEGAMAGDFLLTLFSMTILDPGLNSRADPLPELLHKGSAHEPDIAKAKQLLSEIPRLTKIVDSPQLLQSLSLGALTLLRWIIMPEEFSLSQVSVDEYLKQSANQKFSNTKVNSIKPSIIFRRTSNTLSEHSNLFQEESFENNRSSTLEQPTSRSSKKILWGYHGSPLGNFHSILRKGLDIQYQREKLLYGPGIYFSSGNSVAEGYLSFKEITNPTSMSFGSGLGCIVECKILNEPEYVKFIQHEASSEDYIVVQKNSHVKIDHILVYKSQLRTGKQSNWWIYLIVAWVVLIWMLGRR